MSRHALGRLLRAAASLLLLVALICMGYQRGYRQGFQTGDAPNNTIGSQVYLVTYPVSDLVTSITNHSKLDSEAATVDSAPLIGLITSTVEHESWMINGAGEGEIQFFPQNSSLIIAQTKLVHEQVADLLEQLRQRNVAVKANEIIPYIQSCAAYGQSRSHALRVLPPPNNGKMAVNGVFERSLQNMTDVWGEPLFRGSAGDDDFPQWITAQEWAVWPRAEGLAYIAVKADAQSRPQFIAGWRPAD